MIKDNPLDSPNLDEVFNYKHNIIKKNLICFLNCFRKDDLILMNINLFKFTFIKFFDISVSLEEIIHYLNLLIKTLSKELNSNINYIKIVENDKNKKIVKFEIEIGSDFKLNNCLSLFDINKKIG